MSDKRWLVDSRGFTVCVNDDYSEHVLNFGKSLEDKFHPLEIYTLNSDIDTIHNVLIHRPSGGLGDIICILPAIHAYREKYKDRPLTVALPSNFLWLLRLVFPDIEVVDYKKFHAVGFNKARNTFRHQYFLWCPAGIHEYKNNYRPLQGRIRNFSGSLFVIPKFKILPKINVPLLSKVKLLWIYLNLQIG